MTFPRKPLSQFLASFSSRNYLKVSFSILTKYGFRVLLFCCIFSCLQPVLKAQDFMMQGWYWDYPKPGCNEYAGPSLAADMTARAAAQKNAGFTMMWMPPLVKASFGNCSNGYDPQDLYDYGQISGQTGLGTGTEVAAWLAALTASEIYPIADVVYNHRDGGQWEDNPAVRSYILNYPNGGGCGGFPATPYPVNGKMRYRIPLGGSSSNGAGDYYFKFSSSSGNSGFNGRAYKLFFRTQNTGFINMPINEAEPNGGGDCGQGNNDIFLGRDIFAFQEVGMGCNTDEFHLNIQNGDFIPAGDFLEIYVEEVGGGGSGIDQRIYGIWSGARSMDIMGDLVVQTRTDFSNLPSNQGAMSYHNFKPNGSNPTCMVGDEEFPYFFFDVEQAYDGSQGGHSTRQIYGDWNNWLWSDLGIRGFRMDAVKHFPPSFVGQLLNDLHDGNKNPPMVVGEHFTSDAFVLKNWIEAVYGSMSGSAANAIQVRAFDFELRQALKNACDDGFYDVRNIYNSGIVDRAGMSGQNVVTFINNHDYRTVGEHILNRQMLAYAYILTNNKIGLPSVFHPDYYGVDIYGPGSPLASNETAINELIQIHKTYITGANFVDYLNRNGTPYGSNYQQSGAYDHLLYQLQGGIGGKDVIVVINFENQSLQFNHTINTANAPLGTPFNLMAGIANYTTPIVENNMFNGLPNSLYFDIPANSYAVFVQGEPMVPCPEVQSPTLVIVNSACPSEQGSITASGCSPGTVLQFASNPDGPWLSEAPVYTSSVQEIYVRCLETETGCASELVTETTNPGMDTQQPLNICNNLTVTFAGESQISLDADILFGVSDNCLIIDTILPNQVITCAQVGQNIQLSVTVIDEGNNTASCMATIDVEGLPCSWYQGVNGINCSGGSEASYNPETENWTLNSENCTYSSPFNSDAMSFVQQTLCGNSSIVAQVTGITGGLGWAGVTMRESNAPGSKKAQFTSNLSGNFHRREFRLATNALAMPQQSPAGNKFWLRIDRTGNQFTLYASSNGLNWSFMGSQSILMSPCIEAGLVLTNYNANDLVTATFSNVSVSGSVQSLPAPSDYRALNSNIDLHVYPNPSSGTLYIDLSQQTAELAELQILNLHGQVVVSRSVDNRQSPILEFDMSNQAAGVYFVKVFSSSQDAIYKKFILSK